MMDKTQLAFKLLEWEMKRNELDDLEKEITDAVLFLEKTQNVGNVRASYSGGRATYDYETPAFANATLEIKLKHQTKQKETDWEMLAKDIGFSGDQFNNWTTLIITTDWKAVCKEAEIKPIVLSRTDPSVKIKILK